MGNLGLGLHEAEHLLHHGGDAEGETVAGNLLDDGKLIVDVLGLHLAQKSVEDGLSRLDGQAVGYAVQFSE